MPRWTIRRMMLAIATIGLMLGAGLAMLRMPQPYTNCRIHCASNLRNVVLGVLSYENREGHFPSGTWPNPSLPPEKRLSWYAAILPDLDDPELREMLHGDRSWDDPSNENVGNVTIGVLRCPDRARPPVEVPMPTPFVGIAGLGTDAPFLPKGHPRAGVFGYDRQTALADIKDGAAYTMVVTESWRVRDSWLAGGPATVRGLDTADLPYIGTGRQFGGLHRTSGANVAFADGAVRFISDSIDPRVFEAISTIAGGEAVSPDDLCP
jgi:prepilin-type processing-associated H-X9-DG protein